jgi:hypothetical protein
MTRADLICKIIGFTLIAAAILNSYHEHHCRADGVSTNINDVPLFYSIINEQPKYHDAAFKAQEAFLIQTGISPMYNKVNGYVTDKATKQASSAIDDNMPFSSKQAMVVVGAIYTVGIKKHVTRTFRNPIFPSVTNTVDVSEQQQSIGFKISF